MSVINSMLRDLDRRHAPLPIKTHVQPAATQKHRAWPRSAVALCALFILAIWSWNHHSQQIATTNPVSPAANMAITQPEKNKPRIQIATPAAKAVTSSARPMQTPAPAKLHETGTESLKVDKPASAISPGDPGKTLEKRQTRIAVAEKSDEKSEAQASTPVVKQERIPPDDLNNERYQLARAALAQNQPQRAYELLRDNPPPLARAIDYHAVLAAVEQQLGHYGDASLRYQQLLSLDQNQASWWLGFALSLEGEHRSADALAAYRRAVALNALPDAARQYVLARIAALDGTASIANITGTTNTAGAER